MILGIRPEFVTVSAKDEPGRVAVDLDLVETLGSEALMHSQSARRALRHPHRDVGPYQDAGRGQRFHAAPDLIKVFDAEQDWPFRPDACRMSSDPSTSAAGPTTEELVIEAKEALRIRKPSRIQLVGDHLRREWQLYADAAADDHLVARVPLQADVRTADRRSRTTAIFRGVADSPWIGLEHFETLFNNDQFLRALNNTVISASTACSSAFRCRSCWR